MRKTASVVLGLSTAAVLMAGLLATPVSHAQGQAPSAAVCDNKDNPPTDAAVLGGCIAVNRTKGNCHSCHLINGINYGNIAPPLVAMKARFPDKAKLRTQIEDARKLNPRSVMPPFGPHEILTQDEIDKVVEFVLTL